MYVQRRLSCAQHAPGVFLSPKDSKTSLATCRARRARQVVGPRSQNTSPRLLFVAVALRYARRPTSRDSTRDPIRWALAPRGRGQARLD